MEMLKKLDQTQYPKAFGIHSHTRRMINFIYDLQRDKQLNWQVKLDYININDWHSNLCPAVYVHNKFNPLRVRKYHRCSIYDLKNALKFHFSKVIKGKTVFVYSY
jgi:hypothetical protein